MMAFMSNCKSVSKVPQHDMLLITRDLNAKVRDDNTEKEDAMGWHSCRTINNIGERFVEYFVSTTDALVRKNRAKCYFTAVVE